jgi:hypothetical protein
MRSGSVLGRTAGGTSEIGQAIRRELNSGAPEAFPSERKEIMTRTPFRCAAGVMDLIASRKVAKSPFLLLAQTTRRLNVWRDTARSEVAVSVKTMAESGFSSSNAISPKNSLGSISANTGS